MQLIGKINFDFVIWFIDKYVITSSRESVLLGNSELSALDRKKIGLKTFIDGRA